jgi:hypothetical protein
MTAETFDWIFQELNLAKPFAASTLELTDSTLLEVDGPDALTVPDGVALFIGTNGMHINFDHLSVMRAFDATVTEVLVWKRSLTDNRG